VTNAKQQCTGDTRVQRQTITTQDECGTQVISRSGVYLLKPILLGTKGFTAI
jgi:hypothetical protein